MNFRPENFILSDESAAERLKRIEALLAKVVAVQRPPRVRLSDETKMLHLGTAAKYYGGICPCCATNCVVDPSGKREPSAQFDHWFDNPSKSQPHQTWLICSPCHAEFTRGSFDRQAFMTHWNMYQQRRRDYQQGRQLTLRL